MFNTIKVAIKNTFRNKRRMILTELLIIFGVVVILFATSFLKSMSDNWRNAIVNADLGEIQVMYQGYKEKISSLPLDKSIPQVDQVVFKLKSEEGIAAATKRISVGGLISSGEQTAPFFGRGVDVDNVEAVLPKIYGTLMEGQPLSKGQKSYALLGSGLAKLLETKVGDQLLLTTYDKYKAMNAVEVTVQGFLKIPEEITNDHMLLMDFETAKTLVSFEGEATEIVLKTTNFSKIEEIKTRLVSKYRDKEKLDFYSWSALAGSFNQAAGMFSLVSLVIGMIIYVVVLVALANAILTSVFDRTSEIGMLMALGSSPRRIMFSFVSESIFLGMIGVTIGVIIHKLIILSLSRSGITVPPPPGAIESIVLHPLFDWMQVVSVFVVMGIVTVVAALYPARFASKLNPADTMRAS